jgi:hypothetical protein
LLNERRVSVTTVLGTACGLASWAICARGMGLEVPWHQGILIVLTNALMGFTIGISSLRYHWMTHGALIGLLFGLVLSLFTYSHGLGFWWILILGPVYGFIIELCATVFFRANIDAW